ncbi:hypothetical protein G7Z17_g11331 [Cylindrodendrum hubeiense]|uniref:Uncharacterized protein n=1 Tax=Cylindrodendrum hubeiense TaxID=595255 RepID=A0A9P5H173_9HYPO|nr:hypothetical protein G7Z17_g11331 [Cylindrodendrum hubeiense]
MFAPRPLENSSLVLPAQANHGPGFANLGVVVLPAETLRPRSGLPSLSVSQRLSASLPVPLRPLCVSLHAICLPRVSLFAPICAVCRAPSPFYPAGLPISGRLQALPVRGSQPPTMAHGD